MKYRKKPVVVEAEQFWPTALPWPAGVEEVADPASPTGYVINTLEGRHEVTPGDFIITGVAGERYPCKPEIFAATYEPVDEPIPKETSMREITDHRVNPINDLIQIQVLDRPGAGGASHEYLVTTPDGREQRISFQNGPIGEAGPNGLTQEALIAICVDRLQSFQQGEFRCRENALAITKLEEAQHWLFHRTRARMERGVEGRSVV